MKKVVLFGLLALSLGVNSLISAGGCGSHGSTGSTSEEQKPKQKPGQ